MSPELNPAQHGFQLVVAATRDGGIGKDGTLPWKLSGDMAYFKAVTSQTHVAGKQNAVIMGRKTWESIPPKFRPLAGRVNIVLTRSSDAASTLTAQGAHHVCSSLQEAAALLATPEMQAKVENRYVIGGGQVYNEAIASPLCTAIHLTLVEADVHCDTKFPEINPAHFRLWSASEPQEEGGCRYSFLCYTTTNGMQPVHSPGESEGKNVQGGELLLPKAMASRHDELQYLELVEDIIKRGVFRPDRTGTGTYSRFGNSMRFNLRHTFPLLTSKRTFWRGVAEELLWFVKGSTNAKELQDKNVHIWDGNSSREYLDAVGLQHREEGDLGPVYGFQWRHFGAPYKDMHTDYTGQGVDQLADLIARIKSNPYDRRLLLTAWNPAALKDMALPPCHMFCQFFVAHGELSCLMYQRSCDVGLGVPFNIASYALLTRMVAQVCDLQPGEFVHMMGDTHIYANHVEPLKEQMKNPPKHFPTLKINPAKKDIDSFVMEDFELVGYTPHKKIEMKMAV